MGRSELCAKGPQIQLSALRDDNTAVAFLEVLEWIAVRIKDDYMRHAVR